MNQKKKKKKDIEFKGKIDKSIFLIFHHDFNYDLKKRQFFHDITTLLYTILCTKDYLGVLNFKIAILINPSQFSSLPTNTSNSQNHANSFKAPPQKKEGTLNVPLPGLKKTI